MTEIEVWTGVDFYNMHKVTIKTVKDINLMRRVLDLKEKELKAEEK